MSRATVDDSGATPCVDFVADAEHCPVCGDILQIQKSKRRFVTTLEVGLFQAREIRKVCRVDRSHPVVASERLAHLVPRGQGYGYDLIVQVGLARYLRNLQREEIRADLLRENGIVVSEGTISNLCDRFLKLLERLHHDRVPALRAGMGGGYPLHIDATSEHGKGGLFLCLDGWRGWVLHAVKISSENEQELRPAIEKTVSLFGDPIAVVRDLSAAEAGAVDSLRDKGIPDLVCHYHFLGAIGKKLFDDHYAVLRNLLRSSKVRTGLRELLRELRQNGTAEVYHGRYGQGRLREDLLALILWVLEGEGGKDLPYPFCLPHLGFYQRSQEALQRAERWLPLPRSHVERRALKQLFNVIARLNEAQRLCWVVPKLERGWQAFCELRDILRLSDAELPRGDMRYLSTRDFPEMEMARLQDIEKATMAYHEEIRKRVADSTSISSSPEMILLNYLDRYANHLFGHPARRDEHGRIIAVVERTNNVAEHFFGADKQKLRRRLGRANLGRDLEDQPAQAVLASNLCHSEYVRLVSGSLENLPAAFAKLDQEEYQEEVSPLQRSNKDTKLLKRIGVLIADERLQRNNRITSQQTRTLE
ncbi:MAG: hypothetical protein DRQ47_09645, partial [Gammaproteobacteria bacterium]